MATSTTGATTSGSLAADATDAPWLRGASDHASDHSSDHAGVAPAHAAVGSPAAAVLLVDGREDLDGRAVEARHEMLVGHLAPLGLRPLSLRLAPAGPAATARLEPIAAALEAAADAFLADPATRGLRLGCYAEGVAAASALRVAARRPELFCALALRSVSFAHLGSTAVDVRTPTLFLVGGYEQPGVDFHRLAAAEMGDRARLVILPRATLHGPLEAGTRYLAAQEAAAWLRSGCDARGGPHEHR